MRIRQIMVEVICCLLIMLFVYAAVSKLMDYKKFEVQLRQSPMLTSVAGIVSWLIPAVEISLSFMLMTHRLRLLALYGSFSLMTMFTSYIFILLHFSDFIPCSCGGILEAMTWKTHLYFNLAFVALIAYTIIIQTDRKHNSSRSATSNIYCNKSGEAQNL